MARFENLANVPKLVQAIVQNPTYIHPHCLPLAFFVKVGRVVSILGVCVSVTMKAFGQIPLKTKAYTVTINDSTEYTLKLALDTTGEPHHFFSNIFTPVCLTGECKPVYINFYWDLLGNYIRFDLPAKTELTRMDHKPFKPEDYEKLQTILANTHSLLKDVSMDDLVGRGTENLADSVDAKAGATLKTVKNEVIDGAVYTCYTLWHIAHGAVVAQMQRITETFKSEALLRRFLTDRNHHYQYWAMERVMTDEGKVAEGFEIDMQQVIQGQNIFTARYALQKVSNQFVGDKTRQVWLWKTYQSASYALQIAILKKMTNLSLIDEVKGAVAQQLGNANHEQATLLLKILSAQPTLSDKTQGILAGQLFTSTKAGDIYELLLKQIPKNKDVKRRMAEFNKAINPTKK